MSQRTRTNMYKWVDAITKLKPTGQFLVSVKDGGFVNIKKQHREADATWDAIERANPP